MLRILAVTNLYPAPSTPTSGTFIEQQVKGLRQIGLDVDVMYVNRIQGGMKEYRNLGARVRPRIAAFQPDIVHVMYGGVMADQVTHAVQDRPLVVSFCGADLLGEPLVGYVRTFISKYGVWSSHKAARRAHAIVVKSKNLYDVLPHDIDRSKVRIIPNGIDLERFKPMERNEARRILGWSMESAIVLFATVRGHVKKRPELAHAAIAKTTCDRPVELRIMQGVPHEQVPLWLNASDALILTSINEGSVNIVKEGLACNLPIVAVDVGDVRERLQGVRLSTIAEPTPEALGLKLGEILQQGERSDGRDHVQDLTITAVAERIKEVYLQAISTYQGGAVNVGHLPRMVQPTMRA
jgi:glycosyltransferase involved in cell wall biosynthesis